MKTSKGSEARKQIEFVVLQVTCLALLLAACAPDKASLEGEVFVVTRGGPSIKLGRVELAVYDLSSATKSWTNAMWQVCERGVRGAQTTLQISAEAKAAKGIAEANDAAFEKTGTHTPKYVAKRDEINQLVKAANLDISAVNSLLRHPYTFYYESLESPMTTTKTDSDGRFQLVVPRKGGLLLAARTSRLVGSTTEDYVWLLALPEPRQDRQRVVLSNDNIAREGVVNCPMPPLQLKELPYIPELP